MKLKNLNNFFSSNKVMSKEKNVRQGTKFCLKLYINYQIDALIIIYSQNTILLYMFRASSAHLQEDIVVYKQHMVPSLSIRVLVVCRCAARVRTDWRGKVVVRAS